EPPSGQGVAGLARISDRGDKDREYQRPGIAFQSAGTGRIPDVRKGSCNEGDAPEHHGDGERETLGIGAEALEWFGEGDNAVQKVLDGRGGSQNRGCDHAHQDVQDDACSRGCTQLPPLKQSNNHEDGRHRPYGTHQAVQTGPAEKEQAAHHGEDQQRHCPVHNQEGRRPAACNYQELQPQRDSVDGRVARHIVCYKEAVTPHNWPRPGRSPRPGTLSSAVAHSSRYRATPSAASPSNTIRPDSTTRTRSISSARSRSWVDMTTCCSRPAKVRRSSSRLRRSRRVDGSSRTSTWGLTARTAAKASSWRSPPESS